MPKSSPLNEVLAAYQLESSEVKLAPVGRGLINQTYAVTAPGLSQALLLQEINQHVFPDVAALMANIRRVTDHLQAVLPAAEADQQLRLIPTQDGADYIQVSDGSAWRSYAFLADTYAIDSVQSPQQFEQIGQAFGHFTASLAGLAASEVTELLADFHHTPRRFQALNEAVISDPEGRGRQVQEELAYLYSHVEDYDWIVNDLADQRLPLRVTHNDTKINNVLLSQHTHQPVCVIDLDTVMPGSLLYDFGDAIRYGANYNEEDEADLSRVAFDRPLFQAYSQGFIGACQDQITSREVELLPYAAWLLTTEQAMRFLTDYLLGDPYFKTDYPDHNLVRTRVQIKLAQQMELQYDRLSQLVRQLVS